MVEIIRKEDGQVYITADPGGVFSTHAKLLYTRKGMGTLFVSVVSAATRKILKEKYEAEKVRLKRDRG